MTTAKCLKTPKVSLIVAALLPDFGIGYNGQLPWSLKEEMKYFRKLTTSTVDPTKRNAVIMGRKTYYSIPRKFRPLKSRLNIVLSRNVESLRETIVEELVENEENLRLSDSLIHAIKSLKDTDKIEEIFIIGGAEVYNQLMKDNHDLIDGIYLTEVSHNANIEMDAFFNLDMDKWVKTDESELKQALAAKGLQNEFKFKGNHENGFDFEFTFWKKRI
jgi:dihydrofolate reductase